jgi:formate hydrogenlyase subunit 6/NADH:ubiquinone oxidoreductase subunit I
MSSFIKITVRNFLKGPTTDPYPFGETFVPDDLRGKPIVNEDACTACGTCENVCPSNAISIKKDGDTYTHTIWYNTCCYCGNCEFFCPTGAIFLTNDFHTANVEEEKYGFTHIAKIQEVECTMCKAKFVSATKELLDRAYKNIDEKAAKLTNLCPSCRKKSAFERVYR